MLKTAFEDRPKLRILKGSLRIRPGCWSIGGRPATVQVELLVDIVIKRILCGGIRLQRHQSSMRLHGIEDLVPQNGDEPGPQRRLSLEALCRLHRGEDGVLHDVLRK